MSINLRFPLIWYTVVGSVVLHLIILFIAPGFISGSSTTYTLRDLTFLVEEAVHSQDQLFKDNEVKAPPNPVPQESNEPIRANTSPAPLDQTGLTPVFDPKSGRPESRPVPKTSITVEEAQAELKELERAVANLSDEERLARIPKQKSYLAQVKEKILQHYYLPRKAKYHGMTGEVVLRITIHCTGRLLDTKIIRHSDFPTLDLAAESSVKAAAPFPDITHQVDLPQIDITVTFQYE